MRSLCVIPARYASTRLPGKPLIKIEGKSLIQRVCERVANANEITELIVATDDKRIFDHVEDIGFKVLMTRDDHTSGTERLMEVAQRLDEYDRYINVQGDEPLISADMLDAISLKMDRTKEASIYTASSPIQTAEIQDPNVVKVVTDHRQRAMLFSRAPIPFSREGQWIAKHHQKHVGVYFFSREALLKIKDLPPHPFEQYESLEQLRWLINGIPIYVHLSEYQSFGVDTLNDVDKVSEFIRSAQ